MAAGSEKAAVGIQGEAVVRAAQFPVATRYICFSQTYVT
jgi:hypothetical protein